MPTTQIREATVLDEINTHRPATPSQRVIFDDALVAYLAARSDSNSDLRHEILDAARAAKAFTRFQTEQHILNVAALVGDHETLILAQTLGEFLGHSVNVSDLEELAEQARLADGAGEDHLAIRCARDERDDIVARIAAGRVR